jgi:hypothetical protein
MPSMRLLLAAAAACLALNGCMALAVNQLVGDKQGKAFQPPPDEAAIYLYGVTSCDNTASAVHVRHSQTTLAIYPGTYKYFSVKPGLHHIALSSQDTISIDTQPGQTYFIEAEIVCDGAMPRFHQRVVDPEEGKSKVRTSILGLGLPNR